MPLGNQAMQYLIRSGAPQTKLSVNQPGDCFEHEADRVADAVMRIPEPSAGAPHIQRMCSHCEEELFRKKASSIQSAQSGFQIPGGMGRPLPDSERRFFEPRFGRDLSKVRVHADEQAAESARSMRSLAYTAGHDIVFGADQYQPGTASGRELLAHEITHTIQQGDAGEPIIQRKIGDDHDLTSPRFSGDLVLEAVYDEERLLKIGDKGPAVGKLQQALLDAGFSLPRFGVDEDFGAETKAAVMEFQRASGLIGKHIDGIVGPTTMGWLDQRFSAGPTPAGTTPGATKGCSAIKTISVDLVSLDGSNRTPVADLKRASTIFNQCCIHFAAGKEGLEGPVGTRELLRGDTDLAGRSVCGCPTAEEVALFNEASAHAGLSSSIRAFFVESVNKGDVRAYSFAPHCATGAASGLRGMVVVSNRGDGRSLAHEFGHVLMNSPAHPDFNLNLMSEVEKDVPAGELLTPEQCAAIK